MFLRRLLAGEVSTVVTQRQRGYIYIFIYFYRYTCAYENKRVGLCLAALPQQQHHLGLILLGL